MSGSSLKVKLFDTSGTQVIPVPKSNLTIGSAKHCDVVLDHNSVEGEHLRAWFDSGRVWIQDMGSANGTFLNGIRLPSLKPMLVRELDVLRLGENPSTLGLEANMVRAPVVRATTSFDEVTNPSIRVAPVKDSELEKKRDELAKIRRELAELKLQLQMGRLDKESEDEAHRQLSLMRSELMALNDQKVKVERTIHKMDQQRESQLAAVDNEINERKTTAMTQLKNLMDHEMSKLADWKMQVMSELRRDIHSLSEAKAKSWVTRPLSNDMILEWEAEIQGLLRKVMLGEKPDGEPKDLDSPPVISSVAVNRRQTSRDRRGRDRETASGLPQAEPQAQASLKQASGVTYSDGVKSSYAPLPRHKRLSSKASRDGFKVVLMSVFVGGLVAAAFLMKQGYILKDRSVAGENSGSSQAPSKRRFEPVLTKNFKKTYTDNTLYTEDFIDMELSPGYRNQWLVDFNKTAVNEWKLDMATAKVIADKELMMLQDLRRLRENIDARNEQPGIQAMRERESYFQKELETLLKGKTLTDKYGKLKKTVFARLQAKKP
jgi:hypothetical protein